MEEVKKITQEQLESIRKNQDEVNKILLNLGVLDSQKHALLHSLANVNQKVEEYKQVLEEQYGAININLEDGSYTEIDKDEK
jgi:hypothetical protein